MTDPFEVVQEWLGRRLDERGASLLKDEAGARASTRELLAFAFELWNALATAESDPDALARLEAKAARGEAPLAAKAVKALVTRFRRDYAAGALRVRSWELSGWDEEGRVVLSGSTFRGAGARSSRRPRIAISGCLLDEVRPLQGAPVPPENHRVAVRADRVCIFTPPHVALHLLAMGIVPPVGGSAVTIVAGKKDLGRRKLIEARWDVMDVTLSFK